MCKSLVTALRSLSNPFPVSKAFIKEVCPSSVLQYVIRVLGKMNNIVTDHLTEWALFSSINLTVVQEKRTTLGKPKTGSTAVFSHAWVFGS